MSVPLNCSSSCEESTDSSSSASGERLDDFNSNIALQVGEIVGYQFEPRRDNDNETQSGESDSDQSMSVDEDEPYVRLGNLDW